MSERNKLPSRRPSENFNLEVGGMKYVATVGYDPTGKPAEIFINSVRMSSFADVNASDAAVAVSLALQHGVPVDILRTAMKRNGDGTAQGPLGEALDRL